MNHPFLDGHAAFAWDIDQTLVNGPNSDFFRNYVLARPDAKHVIVTFRTGPGRIRKGQSWAEDVFDELAPFGLTRAHFAGLLGVPDELYEAYARQRFAYDEALVDQFNHWKGMAAASAGCTVLIDDMEEAVIAGCLRHGVTFVNSLNPEFGLLSECEA